MNTGHLAVLCSREPGVAVVRALQTLFKQDDDLLRVDANERSITFRLAMHLQSELPGLHVDCEYNRDGIDPKRIQHLYLDPNAEDTEAKTAFPDIIAHIRGTSRNYLVIEFKKTSNSVSRDIDFAKLRGYRRNLGYEHALFLELLVSGEPEVHRAEWVEDQ